MRKKHDVFLVATAVSFLLTACVDSEKDLLDTDKLKAEYEATFPVSDIDPEMNWRTTNNTTVNIVVNEDSGVNYGIRIYDENPLTEGNATLLCQGSASVENPFIGTFDCPIALDSVFVVRTDEHNRHAVQYVAVSNNAISANFGGTASVKTRAGETEENEYEVKIPIISPSCSEKEINDTIATAIKLTESNEVKFGKIYYVAKGETLTKLNAGNVGYNKYNAPTSEKATIIIAGTVELTANTSIADGCNIYMVKGSKITVAEGVKLSLIGNCSLTMYEGSTLSGKGTVEFTNGEGDQYLGGTINLGTLSSNGGNFYNQKVFKVENLNFSVPYSQWNLNGARLINHGELVVGKTHSNAVIYNACAMQCDNFCGTLVTGNNAQSTIGNYDDREATFAKLTFGENAMVLITGTATVDKTQITSQPTGNALLRMNNVTEWNRYNVPAVKGGNICVEAAEGEEKANIAYTSGVMQCEIANAPFLLIPGACGGTGNTPLEKGETVLPENAQVYTYAFEDNYPAAGDYDFNDVVVDMTKSDKYNSNNMVVSTTLGITVPAVGATKTSGAAIRLKGINKNATVAFGGNTDIRKTLSSTNSPFELVDKEDGDELVIPLFSDAHAIYGIATDSAKVYINTLSSAKKKEVPAELTVTITYAEPITAEEASIKNFDLFIAQKQIIRDKDHKVKNRVEIHTYDYKLDATANGSIDTECAEASGKVIWGICVPNFRFPKENTNISSAYPAFAGWTKDMQTNKSWYKVSIQ